MCTVRCFRRYCPQRPAELAEEGKLIKVHGGALAKSFHFTIESQQVYSLPEKKIIAHKAIDLIKDGMLVVISGGTTMRELVNMLPPDLNATFVTTNVPIYWSRMV